jgi:hypothetical protein
MFELPNLWSTHQFAAPLCGARDLAPVISARIKEEK